MLKKFEIQGTHKLKDKRLGRYVAKKLGGLDRYMRGKYQQSAHLEVHLKEFRQKDVNHALCTATLRLPGRTIVIKEKSLSMYAAIDQAETKLKQQLKKYKDLHGSGQRRRQVFARTSRAAGYL